MTSPAISIVVLTHNRVRLLEDCLGSIAAQTLAPDRVEVVIADDGSTDGTEAFARGYQKDRPHVCYALQPHRGIAAARNLGVRHARGEIVAIVADDYLLDPSYAETVLRFFAATPEASVARFRVEPRRRDWGSRISHAYYDASFRRRLLPAAATAVEGWPARLRFTFRRLPPMPEGVVTDHQLEASGAAAFRREIFERIGPYDETLERAEDSDWTERLRRLGLAVHCLPHPPILHHYDRWLRDTIVKCFATGRYRYRFYRKHPASRGKVATTAVGKVTAQIAVVLDAFWRARQVGTTLQLVAVLPFMLLFELTTKLGWMVEWARDRRPRRPVAESSLP
jgi:GT2 family glycosyltransferase